MKTPMETQEPAKSTAAPRTSRLANVSLLLGICAFISGLLIMPIISVDISDAATGVSIFTAGCALLALMLGVGALTLILKSSGCLLGQGRAMAGIVLGSVFTLTVLLLPIVIGSGHESFPKAPGEVNAIACAVEHYQIEYGKFPGQDSTNSDHLYRGDECRLLLATLQGSNFVWNGKPSNPRSLAFLSVDDRSIVTTNIVGTAQVGEFADPWGNRYEVVADWNGDNKIDAPLADGEAVQRRGVAVWSYGPKGKAVDNPADKTHIRSWR
jgi:hypothetical protein